MRLVNAATPDPRPVVAYCFGCGAWHDWRLIEGCVNDRAWSERRDEEDAS